MEKVRVFKGGKITIPIILRKKFGIHDGEDVMLDVHDDHIVLLSYKTTLDKIRQFVQERCPPHIDLVDELLADRRAEAAREEAKYE